MKSRRGLKLLRTEDQLLSVLGHGPARLVVESDFDGNIFVCDGYDVIARVHPKSAAATLLDRASAEDRGGDLAAWEALPLRYGPCCGMWVLPTHPDAPTLPMFVQGGAHASVV